MFLAPWFPTLRRHGLTPRQVFTWRRQARERAATCRYRRAQSRCLINSDDPVPTAVRLSASAIVRAAISNVATIAVGRRSGACTSTRTMRGGRCGTASGRVRTIANAWASSSTVVQTSPISIGCSPIASGMPTRDVGSGSSKRARPTVKRGGAALANQISMEYPPPSPILLRSESTPGPWFAAHAGVQRWSAQCQSCDHPLGTMATNANLALAEVRTQNFLDTAIALRSHSYFA